MKQVEIEASSNEEIRLWPWMESYARWTYEKPWWPILITVGTCTVLYLWLFCAYGIKAYANTNYYRWSGDDISDRWDSYVGASDATYTSLYDMLGRNIPMFKQFQMTQMGVVIYERSNQNILEVDPIREIWKMEDKMHATPGWEKHCFRIPLDKLSMFDGVIHKFLDSMKERLSEVENGTNCIAFKSMIVDLKRYMRENGFENPVPEDLTSEILENFIRTDEVRLYSTYFGNDYDPETRKTTRCRTIVPFGIPTDGFVNKYDNLDKQNELLGKWQQEFVKPVDEMLKNAPHGVKAYQGFQFALNNEISSLILSQVWWLVGSFAFTLLFAIFMMRSFFMAILGVIGVFLPIPCSLAIMNGVFTIHHVDVIYVISLFMICGTGADALFIIFSLFKQSSTMYSSNEKRLAYTGHRGLLALAASLGTSGVSFLAMCTSGLRIMQFFGIFSFFLNFFTFIFQFTWYFGFLAVWARYFEKRQQQTSCVSNTDRMQSDYPSQSILDCFHKKPAWRVNGAGIPIEKYNVYERFFYNYVSPFLYYYRLPIVVIFFILSVVLGYFCFQIPTKSELQFLNNEHKLQRALTLASNGFATALNDFSFVYVWGLNEHPKVTLANRMTADEYGVPTFRPIDITDPLVQDHLTWSWNYILSQTDIIDVNTTANFGASPWEQWNTTLFRLGHSYNNFIGNLGALIKSMLSSAGITLPEELPDRFPLTKDQYESCEILWFTVLSLYAFEEADPYVPGTLKLNLAGFDREYLTLKYLGMKANMFIPEDQSVSNLRRMYARATEIAQNIESHAPPGFPGFMTSFGWLRMVTEEEIPKQVIANVAISCAFTAIVMFLSTFSITGMLFVLYSMVCTILCVMGILYFTGWEMGCNEAMMVSIAASFAADFIIQPMVAYSHDSSKRSKFGKIQASLTTFSTPVSSALITELAAAVFLYPCQILLFPPFATFLIGSGLFGILHGFVVMPALVGLLGPYNDNILKYCRNSSEQEEETSEAETLSNDF